MSVKLKSPLFSFNARGQFADTIIFQNRNGQALAYHKQKIKDKVTNARRVSRIDYSECVYAWKTIYSSDKTKWEDTGRDYRIAGNNLFVKWFFTELFNSIYGVGFYNGTRYGCTRPTPKLNPYYMLNFRKLIYGV